MATVGQDLRFALRTLVKNKGFTAAALIVLALGIGANSALFSVVDAVLLEPLPYASPERLMQMGRVLPQGRSNAVSITQFLFWRDHSRSFEEMGLYDGRGGGINLLAGGEPERITRRGTNPHFGADSDRVFLFASSPNGDSDLSSPEAPRTRGTAPRTPPGSRPATRGTAWPTRS